MRAERRERGAPHTDLLDQTISDMVAAESVLLDAGGANVLDVGSGAHPPFRDRLTEWRFTSCDLFAGDAHAVGHALPFRDSAFDGSVSFAVFEHLPDPLAALREAARVTRPGGFLLLVTHGVFPYHPSPEDYWRWTGAGLRRMVSSEFEVDRVVPVGGALLCACVLAGFYLDALSHRAPFLRVGTRALNAVAKRLDRHTMLMDGDREKFGALRVGYLVVAHVR